MANGSKEAGPLWMSYRLLITCLCFSSLFCMLALKETMGISLRYMCSRDFLSAYAPEIPFCNNESSRDETVAEDDTFVSGHFNWTEKEQKSLVGSFTIGMILGQLPSSILVLNLGPRTTVTVALIISSLFTFLVHLASKLHFYVLFAFRLLSGIFSAPVLIGVVCLMGSWSYDEENTFLVALATSGYNFGSIMVPFITVPLEEGSFLEVWPVEEKWSLGFYLWALVTFLLSLLWYKLVYNSSTQMAEAESGGMTTPSLRWEKLYYLPWDLLFSKEICGCVIVFSSVNAVYGIVMSTLPMYFKVILGSPLDTGSIASAIPHAGVNAASIGLGYLHDKYKHVADDDLYLSFKSRRWFIVASCVFSSLFCILTLQVNGCSDMLTLGLTALSLVGYAVVTTQIMAYIIDYCEDRSYVGVFFGWVNFVGLITYMLAVEVQSNMTSDHMFTKSTWHELFDFCAFLYLSAAFLFVLLTYKHNDE